MASVAFAERKDLLKAYLGREIEKLVFAELSEEFCAANDMGYMIGIPVPFSAEDLLGSQREGGLDVTRISDNMVMVIGADTGFRYRDEYLEFLVSFFSPDKLLQVLLSHAASAMRERRFRTACVYHRAALLLDDEDVNALFGYACCCREWYLSLEGEDEEELIALLKSEANLFFEYTADADDSFAPAWYYLGYAYLNAGSYKKAELAWERFLRLSDDPESEPVKDVKERMESLIDPVKIEEGVNLLAAGYLEQGIDVLRPYEDTNFDNWWPLHFYLAGAYDELGMTELAIEEYERTAALSPSNTDVYDALARLYAECDRADMAEKYMNKSQLLKEGQDQ